MVRMPPASMLLISSAPISMSACAIRTRPRILTAVTTILPMRSPGYAHTPGKDFSRADRKSWSARLLLGVGRLFLLAQVFARRLIDRFHREPHLAPVVHADELHLHDVALFDHIGHFGDALGRELRNMHQP